MFIENAGSIFVAIAIGNSSKTQWDETPFPISDSARINAAPQIIQSAFHIINAALYMAAVMSRVMNRWRLIPGMVSRKTDEIYSWIASLGRCAQNDDDRYAMNDNTKFFKKNPNWINT